MSAPIQLDLFEPTAIPLRPCGRGLGACMAIIERDQIRCVTCDCVGSAPTIFDDFIRSHLKFLHEQVIAAGGRNPGITLNR